ncbi:MAG: hypothetical protein ACRDIB_10705 [Ardenticatenaceae bacterium]
MEAALEERAWTEEVAERVTDHLRYALLVQAVYVEGQHPRDSALQAKVTGIAATSTEGALALLAERTAELIAAIQAMSDEQMEARVLDPHERGLSVLGHLYDFCRANAMLVEWARPGGSSQ